MSKISKKFQVNNKLGLHARAAALLVQAVNRYAAQVTIAKDGHTVDGRSIIGVLTLGAAKGSKVRVVAKGTEADEAMRAIEEIFKKRFYESD